MFRNAPLPNEPLVNPHTPWSIRAWPPILWQAWRERQLTLHHLGTRVALQDDPSSPPAGQTIWGGTADAGEAGVAWDWVSITDDIVAIADPMSVITNLRLVGERGEVLTALESARYLNEIVHALPWQCEVQRALQARAA